MRYLKGVIVGIFIGIFSTIVLLLSILGMVNVVKLLIPQQSVKDNNAKIHMTIEQDGVYGIDASHHQGVVDWLNLGSFNERDVDFVYLKATEADTWVDPMYHKNFSNIKNTDRLVGSYHFFRGYVSAEHQALNFINTIDVDEQDLKVVIDVEDLNYIPIEEFNEVLESFLHIIEINVGYAPVIYTSFNFYNNYLAGKYPDNPIWIANYNTSYFKLRDSTSHVMHQFTNMGNLYGVDEYVDVNICYDFKNIVVPNKFVIHEKN